MLTPEKIQEYLENIQDWAVTFVPKLIVAGLILWIGMKVAAKLEKLFAKMLSKAKIDIEVEEFLVSIIGMIMKLVVILVAAGVVGVKLSSLLGLLAAVGFAVGLALQGFLGNFASGLTIIFLKPYKVGDWVQIADSFGRVKSIEIFNTTMVTPGDKTLIIPNGKITDDIITNFSTRGRIRLELQVTMPYEESFPRVKEVIERALTNVDGIMPEPKPTIGIETYDSHNIVVAVRPYIHPDEFWDARFAALAAIKEAFSNHKIQVAYSEGVELGPVGL